MSLSILVNFIGFMRKILKTFIMHVFSIDYLSIVGLQILHLLIELISKHMLVLQHSKLVMKF